MIRFDLLTRMKTRGVLDRSIGVPAMKSSSKQASPGQQLAAFIAVLAILGITAGVWYRIQQQDKLTQMNPSGISEAATTPIPTPTPTPTKLFHGKDTYIVSRGSQAQGPNITEVSLDPLDPAVGATQLFSVKASYSNPITSVTLKLRTDTKTTTLPLTRTGGLDVGGVWTGSWTVPENYLYNYIITVTAKSGNEETSIPVTIRERK